MDVGFGNLPRFRFRIPWGLGWDSKCDAKSLYFVLGSSKNHALASVRVWGSTLRSMFRWNDVKVREEERGVAFINSRLQRYGRSQVLSDSGCPLPLFRPYVAKVPWHKGARAFLSQVFPRYGHYCGPNWSSGKDNGSMVWDRRPIDWLDFCCYCHDIGYDTHDQAKLLKADLAFLECLEKPRMKNMGDAHIAHIYRTMCITGTLLCAVSFSICATHKN